MLYYLDTNKVLPRKLDKLDSSVCLRNMPHSLNSRRIPLRNKLEANLCEWGERTIAYARTVTLAGRTGTVMREETEQAAITGNKYSQQLWNEAEEESGKESFRTFADAYIRKVIEWSANHIRCQ